MTQINDETAIEYNAEKNDKENETIQKALTILRGRFASGESLKGPAACGDFLTAELAGERFEVFAVMFLDSRNRVISFDRMFTGTIDSASIHPRVVVEAALRHNAHSVIFAHNHPSGCAEPSISDEHITRRLKDALALIDIRTLDHFIVGENVVSFAERGLI